MINDKKEYNLIDNNGRFFTQWFKAIKPLSEPYGKYQIIAYINAGGSFCGLGNDGHVYNLGKAWKDMVSENKNILDSQVFMRMVTESIENIRKPHKNVVRLTEVGLRNMIAETFKRILHELDARNYTRLYILHYL